MYIMYDKQLSRVSHKICKIWLSYWLKSNEMIEKSTCVTFATTTLLMPKVGNYKIWSKINYGKFYRLILNFMSSLDALSHSFKNTACPYLACFWLPVLFICLFIKLGRAECVRTNVVCALADVVATKLGIIGANVVRAHERFPCGGRRSGH